MKPNRTIPPEELTDLKFYQFVSLFRQAKDFDVIIIGGSYAGLSAAMALGRALKRVLVIDNGSPYHLHDTYSHNFITHDGEISSTIIAKAREQVLKYRTIRFLKDRVTKVNNARDIFTVETRRNEKFFAKKILFATGVIDMIPDIPGFRECWGISVVHCPYCHGYEVANTDIGVLANGDIAYEMVRLLHNWSKYLVLFTNGTPTLTNQQKKKIEEKNIRIVEQKIISLDHKKGQIKNIILENGTTCPVNAVFCKLAFLQATDIPNKQLGCELTAEGFIKTDKFQRTSVPGVYSAGDNSIVSRAISVSAAAGAIAGMQINNELIEESF